MNRADKLTSEQIHQIIEMYPDTSTLEIAKLFKKHPNCIYGIAYRYGIKKSASFLNSNKSGRIKKGQRISTATEFKKGFVPSNKGKKLTDIVKSKEALERTVATRFQKGHKPTNTQFDGAITTRRVKTVNVNEVIAYKFIRISENQWEFYHRYLWMQAYGEIPSGYNVVFKDGNTMNCILDNLECISNADLALRNSVNRFPQSMQDLIHLKGSLTRAIRKAIKKEEKL